MIDYLEMRCEEPCGRSAPNSVIAAFSFFEKVGAVSEGDKVSVDGSLLQVARSMEVDLTRGKTVAKKAAYAPINLVVA